MDCMQTHFGSPYDEIVEKPAAKSVPAISPEEDITEKISLLEYLERHPEINYLRLIYVWPYYTVYTANGFVIDESGTYLDEEYSYVGTIKMEKLKKFLNDFEWWDEPQPIAFWKSCHFKTRFEWVFEDDRPVEDRDILDEDDYREENRLPLLVQSQICAAEGNRLCSDCKHLVVTKSGYAHVCHRENAPMAHIVHRTEIAVDCPYFEERIL